MSFSLLNRKNLKIKSLSKRYNYVNIINNYIRPHQEPEQNFVSNNKDALREIVEKIEYAKKNSCPIILAFGAHTIKNGLVKVINNLIENNWITHLATNGAGIIHDWEFAYQGKSSEDVKTNVKKGEFGIWEETGFYLNLALILGAYKGLGYGESIGALIYDDSLYLPDRNTLKSEIKNNLNNNPDKSAAAADLLSTIQNFNLTSGEIKLPHNYKEFSIQKKAYELKIPFTAHPMFGHDIIYTHPINKGASIGRTAEKDFLNYANQIKNLEGGVYLSVGSAVMSPMIFEKSISMSKNLALQENKQMNNYYIAVVDLAENTWDWNKGEPPKDNSAYYLRYCKTFNRMGGTMKYISGNNKDFLLYLNNNLK